MKQETNMSRRQALAMIAGIAVAGSASGQAPPGYPTRTIRFVQPFAAGSGPDVTSRYLVRGMGARLGVNVVVENKVGAVGIVGMNELIKAAPDGYTLGYVNNAISVSQWLLAKGAFELTRDFVPVGALTFQSNILVVAPDFPADTPQQLVDRLRERPGAYSYASGGNGTPAHLNGDIFRRATGVQVVHVPYKSLAGAINDVSRGDVHYLFGVATSVMPAIRSKRLRPLAVAANQRMPLLPDVPTMEEAGFKGMDVRSWGGILAPGGTPPAVVERLRQALGDVLSDPETKRFLEEQGSEAADPAFDFDALVRSESQRWKRFIQETGLRAD